MSRRKTPRTTYLFTYTKLDELLASPTEPIDAARRTHQLLMIYQGLRALEQDAEPTFDDWLACSDAVNLTEALIEMGVVEDEGGLLNEASQALGRAGWRSLDGHRIRLDAPGLLAVRQIVASYAELLAQLPARTMIAAHRRTEHRLLELRTRRHARPGDIRLPARAPTAAPA